VIVVPASLPLLLSELSRVEIFGEKV